jgi:proteasome lid subunit RPN8/RPN11
MKKYVFFLAFWLGTLGSYAQTSGSFVLDFGDDGQVEGRFSINQDEKKLTIDLSALKWTPPETKDELRVDIEWVDYSSHLKLTGPKKRLYSNSGFKDVFLIQSRGADKLVFKLSVVHGSSNEVISTKTISTNFDLRTEEDKAAEAEEIRRREAEAEAEARRAREEERKRRENLQKKPENQQADEANIKAELDSLREQQKKDSLLLLQKEQQAMLDSLARLEAIRDSLQRVESGKFDLQQFISELDDSEKIIYGGGLGLLFLIIMVLIFRGRGKKQSPDESPTAVSPSSKTPVSDAIKINSIQSGIKVAREKKTPADKAVDAGKTPLGGLDKKYNLEELWRDTAVKNLVLTGSCIEELDRFVREKNVSIFEEENDTMIPEIGGFLLGSYTEIRKNQYDVLITKFVPITPEDNDTYRIEFGTQAWLELDIIKEEFPDLDVIGWFHTHPGHGLFLSRPDLNIHEGFFRNNFQVAMEMDTMTERLDIAFFTRAKNGQLNNTANRKKDSWFSWRELTEEMS